MNRHLSEWNVSLILFVNIAQVLVSYNVLSTNRKATRPTFCSLLSTDPNSWFETSSKPIYNTTTVNIAGSCGWICCFNEWKQTWTLKRRNWNKFRMTSVLGCLHPTGDAADFLVQPWMTYWQQYWPLTSCSHEVFSVPSGSDMIPKWTASVHTGPVFLLSLIHIWRCRRRG